MASCLITITGTSGSVLIQYTLSGNPGSMTVNYGQSVYINDAATAITYTRLSGDAVAASGCVTITAKPSQCYLFQWETINQTNSQVYDMVFDAILDENTVYSIDDVEYTTRNGWNKVAVSLAALDNENIIPLEGIEVLSNRGSGKNSLIVRTIGFTQPYLRVHNPASNFNLYVKGVASDCSEDGYEEFNNCVESDL